MGMLGIFREFAEGNITQKEYDTLFMIETASELNEINKGPFEAIAHVMQNRTKNAKALIQEANKAYRDEDYKTAKKKIDQAIDELKKNRKDAEKIDDDGFLSTITTSMILSLAGPIGTLAGSIGFFYSWYTLRTQTDKGDTYSNRNPERKKNLILEFFLGKYRAAGWSRSMVLASYDKLIDEANRIKSKIDNQ